MVQDHSGEDAFEPPRITILAKITVLHVPGIANGRMDIGHMKLIGAGQDPLGDRVAAGDNEVVIGKIELLDRKRHQRQKHPMLTANKRHALQKARVRLLESKPAPVVRREDVEQGEDIRLRIAAQDFAQHPLSPANRVQPIVDDRDAQRDFPFLWQWF
jgi:hypothetical protein